MTAVNSDGSGAPALSNSVATTGTPSTYAVTVIADHPSVYYRLDDGAGLSADSSGSGNDGAYNTPYTQAQGSALPSDGDSSAAFQGICCDHSGNVTSTSGSWVPTGSAARTVELWFQSNTGGLPSKDGQLLSWGSTAGTRQYFGVRVAGTQLTVVTQNDDHSFTAPYAIENAVWHQVVVSYDGNVTLSLYLDGQSLGTATLSGPLATASSNLTVGSNLQGWGSLYAGGLDEVSVYPAALSASQVGTHWAASGYSLPSAPGTVTATAGANQATVSWAAASSAGTPVQRYLVRSYLGGQAQNSRVVTGTAASATLTGLKGGSAYTFQVTAQNNYGSGPVSPATAPVTPTGSTSTYASTVLGDAPSYYYRLDDGDVVAADSSGHGHDAWYNTPYTQAQGSALPSDGDSSAAFQGICCDRSGDVVQGQYAPYNGSVPTGSAARTVELWFQSNTGGLPSKDGQLLSWGSTAGTRQYFGVRLANGNQIAVVTGNDDKYFTAPYAIENATWHQVVVGYDGNVTLSVYLDGKTLGNATLASPLSTVSTGLTVGSNLQGWGSLFAGGLDDVSVYPAALTTGQVANHWTASGYVVPSPPSNVTAWAGPGQVRLSWTENANPPVSSYVITPYTNGVAGTPTTVDGTLTTVTIPQQAAGTPASYQVAPQAPQFGSIGAGTSPTVTPSQPLAPTGDANSLGVFVAYADNQHGGSFFPNPWPSSGPADNAGVLLTNNTSSDITGASVSVTIGSGYSSTWGSNLTVLAGRSLAIVGPDTSELMGCTVSAVQPVVHVTVGTGTTDYTDTNQVLVSGGWDKGACNVFLNEGSAWQQPGGGLAPWEILGAGNESEHKCTCDATKSPVNTASGNFWHQFSDLVIPGRGISLQSARTYNSLAAANDGPFGFGWVGSYTSYLTQDLATNAVVVHQEGGSTITFAKAASGYVAPAKVLASLAKNADGSFTLTRNDQTKLTFNLRGELTSESDHNGYATTLTYQNDQLASIIDPAGRTLTLSYTGPHITGISDQSGRSVAYAYDPNGNLVKVTDAQAGVTAFSYDPNHLLLVMKDANCSLDATCQGVVNVYDASGRVKSQTDAMQRQTSFAYTPGQTTITDPKGNVESQQYQNNQLVSDTKGFGTLQAATWKYGYDANTLGVATVTDPSNTVISQNVWDARGNLLTHKDALLRQTSYSYYVNNALKTGTDPSGVTTTMTYDGNWNVQTVSTPLTGTSPPQSRVTTYTRGDPAHPGDVTSMTDPDGKVWTYSYDAYGDLAGATDPIKPAGDTITYGYNSLGEMTSEGQRGRLQLHSYIQEHVHIQQCSSAAGRD